MANLKAATVVLQQMEPVVGLQRLVGELGEADASVRAAHAALDAVPAEHGADAKVAAHRGQKVGDARRLVPVGVVHQPEARIEDPRQTPTTKLPATQTKMITKGFRVTVLIHALDGLERVLVALVYPKVGEVIVEDAPQVVRNAAGVMAHRLAGQGRPLGAPPTRVANHGRSSSHLQRKKNSMKTVGGKWRRVPFCIRLNLANLKQIRSGNRPERGLGDRLAGSGGEPSRPAGCRCADRRPWGRSRRTCTAVSSAASAVQDWDATQGMSVPFRSVTLGNGFETRWTSCCVSLSHWGWLTLGKKN